MADVELERLSSVPEDQNAIANESFIDQLKKYPIVANWKTLFISFFASMFEFYDFGILGFFTVEIGHSLLPPQSKTMYHVEIFALFWTGFIARPFGGALFGYISDKHSRKTAFISSIISMGIVTFLTGCIPSYSQIGIWSVILLLSLRLIQGLSTGGECASVFCYLYEVAPPKRRALWMSINTLTTVGALAATTARLIIDSIFTEQQITKYAWRFPFYFGAILILLGWWSVYALKESPHQIHQNNTDTDTDPVITQHIQNNENAAVEQSRWSDFVAIFCVICASALNHCSVYLYTVFLPDFLKSKELHEWIDPKAYDHNLFSILFMGFIVLVTGYYTDSKGPLRFLVVGHLVTAFLAPMLWYSFTTARSSVGNFLIQLTMCGLAGLVNGAIYFWYFDVLLANSRNRTMLFGIGYNTGAILWGGASPVVASSLIVIFGSHTGVVLIGGWVLLLCTFALVTIFYVTVKRKQSNTFGRIRGEMNIHDQTEERQQLTAAD